MFLHCVSFNFALFYAFYDLIMATFFEFYVYFAFVSNEFMFPRKINYLYFIPKTFVFPMAQSFGQTEINWDKYSFFLFF